MAPRPEAIEKTPQQAIQPKNTAQRPMTAIRSGWLLSKLMARHIKSDPTKRVAPSMASRTPLPRFSSRLFPALALLSLSLPPLAGRFCPASESATALRSAPHERQNLGSSIDCAAHRGQYMCYLSNLSYSISLKQAPQTGSSGISSKVWEPYSEKQAEQRK
jgi:hypothetical protein